MDAQRLRKVLASAGVIAEEMLARDHNRCVFDAAAGEAVAQTLADSLTLKGLASALHVGHHLLVNLLVRDPFGLDLAFGDDEHWKSVSVTPAEVFGPRGSVRP